MPVVSFTEVTEEDIAQVSRDIRRADVLEFYASSCSNADDVARKGLKHSKWAYAAKVDGLTVCIFGLGDGGITGIGVPWLIGTNALDRYPLLLLKASRPALEVMKQSGFKMLSNYVDERNVVAIRWLKWLGFTIDEPKGMGAFNVPFCRFWMEV